MYSNFQTCQRKWRSSIFNNKASGKNPASYLRMLFPYAFKNYSQDKVFKNVLKIIEPFAMTNNSDLLRVCQKIILELDKLGNSFIRKNSSVSSRTISRLKKQQEDIYTSPPKKTGAKRTPKKVINKFIDYLDQNSEPADSGTPPVITSKDVKAPVRYLTKPVDALINDYEPFQEHIKQKNVAKYKNKLHTSSKRAIIFNSKII